MFSNSVVSTEIFTTKRDSLLRNFFLVGLGSILIALCGSLSIKLPFTPVPISLVPHVCLFLGAVLGRKRGALAVLGYLFQGAIGLPVFALGTGGFWHLLGPRGGYLFGYVVAAYVTGLLIERLSGSNRFRIFLALIIGNASIYFLGLFQLSLFLGIKSAVLLGLLPFLVGDALKLMIVYRGLKEFR